MKGKLVVYVECGLECVKGGCGMGRKLEYNKKGMKRVV